MILKNQKFLYLGLFIYLSTFVIVPPNFAQYESATDISYQASSYLMRDSLSKSTKEASLSLNAINGLSVDSFTGSANLNIPLSMPPGRMGIAPALNLNYSTANPNGPLGLGWKLELGYVERSTKEGIPKYDSSDKFIFSLGGMSSELVDVGSNTYRPKREPQNYKFTFDGAYWKAKDKLGRTYYFGDRYSSASVETDSGSRVFRWYLVRLEDTQGNYMVIEYGAGQYGCPSKIYYTRHTNNPTTSEIYIEFLYESTERQDIVSNYRPGFYLTNSKRLSQIKAWLKESTTNKLIKRYAFEYKYSLLTNRSLLTKITEYGSDGTTALPAITFSYQDTNTPAYTISSINYNDFNNNIYFADFNGDGLTDIGNFYYVTGEMKVRLSTGSGFAEPVTWITNFGSGGGLKLGDFNADGRTDLCFYKRVKNGNQYERDYYVALSDGRKFVDKGLWLSYTEPSDAYKVCTLSTVDINGDGRSDIIIHVITFFGSSYFNYFKNTGTAFVYTNNKSWSPTMKEAASGDFDGDGLPQICGFNPDTGAWSISPLAEPGKITRSGSSSMGFGSGKAVFSVDANNDGITDIGYYNYSIGKIQIKTFMGKGFSAAKELPFTFSLRGQNTKVQSADFNGDGLGDYLVCYNGKIEIAYSQNTAPPDLLLKVDNGIGGGLGLSYKSSSNYTNKRSDGTPGLPFVIPVFYQSKITDGRGNTYTTTYSYLGGLYDDAEKEFAGFSYCGITNSEGTYTEQFFRQDKPLRGKLYKEMVKNVSGNLYLKAENIWKTRELYPGVSLSLLEQRDVYTYDGDESFKQVRTSSEYDDYANPTKITYAGDASVWGDEKTQISEYNYNVFDWLVSLPSLSYALDQNNNKVSEKRFYYDGAVSLTTPATRGLLTKEESRLYNPLTFKEEFLASQYQYDTFGNLVKITDALGRSASINYDSKLMLYPVKKTNALGYAAVSTYDYGTGNILSVTEPNNQTTSYRYDVLGRLSKVIGPNDNESSPGITYAYNLSSRPTSVVTSKRIVPLQGSLYTAYSFYDGLGRLIQAKAPAESGTQVVSDVVKFDSQGRIKEKYLPYFVSSSSSYSVPNYSQPKTTFAYDCLGRIIQTTNPDGTYNSITYSDGMTTSVDENSHYQNSYLDAYGRVIKVEEYNSAQIYTTTYEYDAWGNLVKVIDDQNNIIQMWYDSLGRKIKMNDPDMGVWAYEYDKVGSLVKQTDAKGKAIEFTYDALNRITAKKSSGMTLAGYSYDDTAKQYCIGRLSKVTDTSGTTEYFYDKVGRQIKFIKTVEGSSYSFTYTYDALDRVTSMKYPDSEIVNYTYNASGAIETVKGLSPQGTVPYVSNIDYSSTGQITKIAYGNGTFTNYTYNPQNLRLTNIITQSPFVKVQDLSYQFDKVGNIANILDRVNTASQDFLYDDLDRLTQARGRYGVAAYDYNSIGNMLYKEGVSFTYGQAGKKPHALTSSADGSTFTYDNNGNLLEESTPSRGRVKYYYDVQNNLVRVEPQRPEFSFSVNLKPGWNFISLPVVPRDSNILQVLKGLRFGLDYDQVARFNPASKTWEMFTNQPEFDQFYNIEYGKGYQIYITNPSGVILTVSGYRSTGETAFPVSVGWNLIGFPYWLAASPVETALRPISLGVDYDTVERYNSASRSIEKYTATQKQFTQFKQGEAYYLKALKNTVYKVAAQDTSVKQPVELNEFVYDSSGNRVKKITSQGATIYIGELFEKLPDGSTRKHIFAGGQRICTKGLSPTGTVPEVYYYHSDHLGSSNVITDKTGKQIQLAEYTPYGEIAKGLSPQGTVPDASITSYLFTGKELDSSGLYYYGARFYHSQIAHFTQPDPVISNLYDPQSLNHYSYCRNNPLNLIDPTGMSFGSIWDPWGKSITNSWNNLTSSFSTGISTIGNWGKQIGSGISDSWKDFTQSGWGKGIGSGLYNGAIGLSVGIVTAAWISTFPISTPIMAGVGYGLAIIGGTSLGLSTGAGIAGYDIFGHKLTDYRRGELLGGSLLGWGMLGLGAWDQFRQTGSLFGIKNNLVIGKLDDLNISGALRLGERRMNFPDQGSPKANWEMNSGLLRIEMQKGLPIRDISDPLRYNTNCFLAAERNLLRNHGWKFNQETSYWNPLDW